MEAKIWMSVIIAGLMILSVIGFVLVDTGSSDYKHKFGDYTFYRTQQGWRSKINGQDLFFNFLPDSVSQIPLDEITKTVLTSTPIIAVSYDPNDHSAQSMGQLQYYLEQLLNPLGKVFVQRGLINATAYPALSEISCHNASKSMPVIVFEHQNLTQVISDDFCIRAQVASGQDLFMITDRILYVILGVL